MQIRYRNISLRSDNTRYSMSTEQLITYIKEAEAKALSQGGTDLNWNIGSYHEYGDDYGELELCFCSPETEQEKKDRVAHAKRDEAAQRQTYEQLRKKFEKDA